MARAWLLDVQRGVARAQQDLDAVRAGGLSDARLRKRLDKFWSRLNKKRAARAAGQVPS
jgi:hypothetical protein